MSSRGEPADVTNEGDESGGGEKADAGDGSKVPDGGDLSSEEVDLDLDLMDAGVEVVDLGSGLTQGDEKRSGNGVGLEGVDVGDDVFGSHGDGDAKLPEETADGVDARGAGVLVGRPESVESSERLLVVGLNGDRLNVFVSEGFEDGFRIGFVSFVSVSIASDVMWREEGDGMAELLEVPSPVMSGTTRLEEDAGGLLLGHETLELRSREPVVLGDPTGVVRDGDLKDGLGEINGDGMLHSDSSLLWPVSGAVFVLALIMPN